MPNNYVLLETIALTQSASSVTFDNLPTSGYTDLKVILSTRSTISTVQNLTITFNGVTTGYSARNLFGAGGGTPGSSTLPTNTSWGISQPSGYTASTFDSQEIYIPNYRSSNFKSASIDSVTENNAADSYAVFEGYLWSNTAAITSINIAPNSGNFVANSTFSLYGIAALGTTPVLAPKATGGNRIENDGTYWIHTFTSSGNFIPQVALTCDVLVVAGGGGGGSTIAGSNTYAGGGGGAGGFRALTAQGVSNGVNYLVTVGAGGAGGASGSPNNGVTGSNSVFSTITSAGGGFGALGNLYVNNGGAGGSGGASTNTGTGGAASPSGQGSAGASSNGTWGSSGGGGGASAAGSDVTSQVGGAGGAGTANSYSGSSITYAGGGGGGAYSSGGPMAGGAGGAGGGGTGGANASAGVSGTANTGGGGGGQGGGGGGGTGGGGAGGSGIVIIRYPIA